MLGIDVERRPAGAGDETGIHRALRGRRQRRRPTADRRRLVGSADVLRRPAIEGLGDDPAADAHVASSRSADGDAADAARELHSDYGLTADTGGLPRTKRRRFMPTRAWWRCSRWRECRWREVATAWLRPQGGHRTTVGSRRGPANRVEEHRLERAVVEEIGLVSELEVDVPRLVARIRPDDRVIAHLHAARRHVAVLVDVGEHVHVGPR